MSAEQWWATEDHLAVIDALTSRGYIWPHDMAQTVLAALAPTVERIRRDAKAEALREAADAYLAEYGTWGGAWQGKWLRDRAARIEAGQ